MPPGTEELECARAFAAAFAASHSGACRTAAAARRTLDSPLPGAGAPAGRQSLAGELLRMRSTPCQRTILSVRLLRICSTTWL